MSKLNEVGSYKTAVIYLEGKQRVIFHETCVVSWDDEEIILNTGGRKTSTIKRRMNQASKQYGLGFGVYQNHSIWFVIYEGSAIEFEDGIILARDSLL